MSVFGTIRDAVTGLTAGVAARTQTPSGNALQVQIGPGDIISNIPVLTLYDHHQVHEGETWRWSVYVSSLASGNSKDIQLVVPNITITTNVVTQCPHLRYEVVCDSLAQIFLYEAPTISVNGTSRTPINQERNGTYTVQLGIREDPTVTSVGTQIWQGINFASKTSAGSIDGADNEFVLKNNTTYLFRVTSGAAGAKVLIRLVWYEDLGV